MKFNLKPMDLVQNFLSICSVVGILGGIAYSAGWIVSRAGAGEISQQQVYEEALDRERADLQFQIDMATMKMKFLAEKADRDDYDNMELDLLQTQVAMLQSRLAKLNEPEADE